MPNSTAPVLPARLFTVREYVPGVPGGRLDGWTATCVACGLTITTSMSTMLDLEQLDHRRWHEANGQ